MGTRPNGIDPPLALHDRRRPGAPSEALTTTCRLAGRCDGM